jgi:hypothetical protein
MESQQRPTTTTTTTKGYRIRDFSYNVPLFNMGSLRPEWDRETLGLRKRPIRMAWPEWVVVVRIS